MNERDRAKRRLLRALCVIAWALGAGMFALGWLPGTEIYEDANNCAGHAFDGWFVDVRPASCTPHYVLASTARVLDTRLQWLSLALMLAPGAFVWWKPKLGLALLWSVLAIPTVILAMFVWLDLYLLERTVSLWPRDVFAVLASALVILLVAGVPIACAVFAYVIRTRKPEPPVFPTAQVESASDRRAPG